MNKGKVTNTGRCSHINELGKVFMILKLSECMTFELAPPQFLLNATTGLMRFYPAFLKASMLLQRFVQ